MRKWSRKSVDIAVDKAKIGSECFWKRIHFRVWHILTEFWKIILNSSFKFKRMTTDPEMLTTLISASFIRIGYVLRFNLWFLFLRVVQNQLSKNICISKTWGVLDAYQQSGDFQTLYRPLQSENCVNTERFSNFYDQK